MEGIRSMKKIEIYDGEAIRRRYTGELITYFYGGGCPPARKLEPIKIKISLTKRPFIV